jgi:mutator protein MutT
LEQSPKPSSNHEAIARWTEVAVAVVFRRGSDGVELLIGRRRKEAIRGGLYEFPGGKIEPGESPAEAALREVEEEVGLGGDVVLDGPTALVISAHSDPELARERSVRLHAFLVEVRRDAEPRALGSGEVRWIRVDELANFEWPKANSAINDAIRGAFGDGANR